MPPPWNANYQRAFAAIVRRTADYVRAQGVTIAVAKLTGINATSEELRVPAETPDATQRIQRMYVAAFARPPERNEIASILSFVEAQRARPENAVWADVAHVLFNSAEFIYVP